MQIEMDVVPLLDKRNASNSSDDGDVVFLVVFLESTQQELISNKYQHYRV